MNFEMAKIQFPSKINLDLLDTLCGEYWDYQLPYFLKFGFPLDFQYQEEGKLLLRYPEHVHTYLDTEIHHKAILAHIQRNHMVNTIKSPHS